MRADGANRVASIPPGMSRACLEIQTAGTPCISRPLSLIDALHHISCRPARLGRRSRGQPANLVGVTLHILGGALDITPSGLCDGVNRGTRRAIARVEEVKVTS